MFTFLIAPEPEKKKKKKVNINIFSLTFLHFDKRLLLLTVTLRGVSNKHCLLSLFSFISFGSWFSAVPDNDNKIMIMIDFIIYSSKLISLGALKLDIHG